MKNGLMVDRSVDAVLFDLNLFLREHDEVVLCPENSRAFVEEVEKLGRAPDLADFHMIYLKLGLSGRLVLRAKEEFNETDTIDGSRRS